jgi:hypothetical protein
LLRDTSLMIWKHKKALNYYYPQNYIIRHPVPGATIIALFCFGFSALYKPSDFHASPNLSYELTMIIYSLVAGVSVIMLSIFVKKTKPFRSIGNWTLIKELLSVVIILSGTSIAVYLMGFIVESSAGRLNLPTFLNSFKNVFSVGIIPFAFFTAANYPYLFHRSNIPSQQDTRQTGSPAQSSEDLINISSQLKKEELKFYPSQFLYAESDGNYVVFYLLVDNHVKKQIIRNSMSSIEQQLSGMPFFLRTHRSFIVNLNKVKSRQGNILGYQLKLGETEFRIPVSRERIRIFDLNFARYHS